MINKNTYLTNNITWFISIMILFCFVAKPIHEVMKMQNFVIDNFIDLEETNEKDVFEIDETQFDKELVYKSKKTTNQHQSSNSKSVKSIISISFKEINIDIIIPPPDYSV
tara:strand:- start:572 stop:901 length:330 start_codon:yes stop_codon:yes gene_type:complete